MQGPNTSLIPVQKAPWWNRVEGGGNYTQAGAKYGQAFDNQYQREAYDSSSSNASGGNVIPTIQHSDQNGRTRLNNPNGVVVASAAVALAAPTVTPVGGSATTWSYVVVGRYSSGATVPASTAGTTTTGAATLTGTAYNAISGVAPQGVAFIDIYRTAVGSSPTTTGLIATITCSTLPASGAWSFNDIGGAGDTTTAPTGNTTGGFSTGVGQRITTQVTLTAAQIIAMGTTPVSILGTPGANKVIIVEQILLQMKPTATQFTTGGAVTFVYHGGSVTPHAGNIPAATINSASASNNQLAPIAATIQPPTNTGIDITAAGVFAVGTGTAVVTITYMILSLS